jgi:hypothetical protein
MDMLARSDGGERHFLVKGVRGGNRNHIYMRVGDQRFPVCCRSFEAILMRRLGRSFGRNISNHAKPRRWDFWKGRQCGAIGEGMGLAHEACADDADAKFFHGSLRFSGGHIRVRGKCKGWGQKRSETCK